MQQYNEVYDYAQPIPHGYRDERVFGRPIGFGRRPYGFGRRPYGFGGSFGFGLPLATGFLGGLATGALLGGPYGYGYGYGYPYYPYYPYYY